MRLPNRVWPYGGFPEPEIDRAENSTAQNVFLLYKLYIYTLEKDLMNTKLLFIINDAPYGTENA